ncbi:hypothetical protein ACFSC4_25550 [Deinococcus malanensis]|nr:hypothetical protein [Deinococcus malanensis]
MTIQTSTFASRVLDNVARVLVGKDEVTRQGGARRGTCQGGGAFRNC